MQNLSLKNNYRSGELERGNRKVEIRLDLELILG